LATALLIPIEYIPDHLLFTQMTIRAKAFGAISAMLEDLDRPADQRRGQPGVRRTETRCAARSNGTS
jgi:hypothetical protein